jgi:hypothetical protein
LTRLSPDHNFNSSADPTLRSLLELNGESFEVGGGFRARFEAARVAPTPDRPHGIRYSLRLFAPDGSRVVCFDNAHPVKVGSGPAARTTETRDHFHLGGQVRPYRYVDAGTLMRDFWTAVDTYLKREGAT